MNNKPIRVLPREVFMATKWAFRAAQIPAGYGVAASEMIQYAEMYHGIGLSTLQQQLSTLEHSSPTPPIIVDEDEGCALMDGGGQSVLICAPGALDLACANAKEYRNAARDGSAACDGSAVCDGIGLVCVENVGHGLALLEQLADQAARRGLVCLLMTAVTTPKEANRTMIAFPHEEAPLIIHAALRTPSQTHIELINLVRNRGLSPSSPVGSRRLSPSSPNLIRELFTNAFIAPPQTNVMPLSNNFLILCVHPNRLDELSDLESDVLKHVEQVSANKFLTQTPLIQQPHERAAKRERAHRHGLETDYAIWSEIKQFGNRIQIPV